jgi:enoyl-CoA hydratase/carnithine racemase
MKYETVVVENASEHVLLIRLNRPDKLNTFSRKMAEELDSALKESDRNEDVRTVLIKGEGKAFCAGIDVNELKELSVMEYRELVEIMEHPFLTISRMKKPVIASVHGVAAANGMGLVASADLAIASDDARMGLTAINIGLNCVGPVIPVSRCVGRKKALEFLLYGDLITASEALDLGLVNRTVPLADLEKEAMAWAEKLAEKSPIAVQMAKKAFYTAEDMDYERQFAYMNEAFARLCTTEDSKEGISAFFKKRTPHWKGK